MGYFDEYTAVLDAYKRDCIVDIYDEYPKPIPTMKEIVPEYTGGNHRFRHVDFTANKAVYEVVEEVADIVGCVSDVAIRFVRGSDLGYYNYIDCEVCLNRQEFIDFDETLSKEENRERLKFVLLHELRHRDQIDKGILVVNSFDGAKWCGIDRGPITSMGLSHYTLPWEVDANAYAARYVNTDLLNNFKIWLDIMYVMRFNSIELKMHY